MLDLNSSSNTDGGVKIVQFEPRSSTCRSVPRTRATSVALRATPAKHALLSLPHVPECTLVSSTRACTSLVCRSTISSAVQQESWRKRRKSSREKTLFFGQTADIAPPRNATSKERSWIQCAGCDAIQKGESDFEMESEDSDTDMSEEEVEEHARGHMDKENQQPNDPPVSDYVDIEPQQHLCPIGTRQVRLPNCNVEEEKSLKKKGRGSFDIQVEDNHNICAVKWYDSRAVTLVSSFAGPDPVQRIPRWDKANKTYVEVERPYIVGTYNNSRRWYVYIFWHTIILAVINAWLLYKREGKALKMPKQEILTRRQFQADLASSLILVNTTPLKTPKRGRPSSGNGSPAATVTSRSLLNAQKRPSSGDGSPAATVTSRSLLNAQKRPSSGDGSPAATVTSRSPLNAQKRPSSGDGSPPNRAPSKRSQPPLDRLNNIRKSRIRCTDEFKPDKEEEELQKNRHTL
ncbi:hypothetical protein F7725_020035 [Dissostichus mawsoni]|uniref:PiggyBac transposable element-derived protein domain-containing protein n=1 Tax=Dissostichus mawsoni TaxID=36200 RepID=A0A7J5YLE5_DISMA|nr:hypothetical protein F7725_020035 [Dissostichus mawsoni]